MMGGGELDYGMLENIITGGESLIPYSKAVERTAQPLQVSTVYQQ